MRLLLDTYALLWALREPSKLSDRAAQLVRDPANELVVSAASAWEIATKDRLGRLPHAEPLVLGWTEVLDRFRATEMPITAHHAIVAGGLDWAHRDPFDRVLAAQAIVETLPLVTTDGAFAGLGAVRLMW